MVAAALRPAPRHVRRIGGDRGLVREVLEGHAIRALHDLPVRELYDLPDPRRDVLETALRRGRAVRVQLTESEADPDAMPT